MESPHHISRLIHGSLFVFTVLKAIRWVLALPISLYSAPLPPCSTSCSTLGLSWRTHLQNIHTTQKNTSCSMLIFHIYIFFPHLVLRRSPAEGHLGSKSCRLTSTVRLTFRCNFAVTSFVFEALYKKGLTVTYTCTTDEVVASWSVKATAEERPVELSPWRVMLVVESSEDKSSLISSGHSGSGFHLWLCQCIQQRLWAFEKKRKLLWV